MNAYHRGPDNSQIDVNLIGDVIHWCRRLGCSQEQLRSAVAAVGSCAEDVRSYLGRNRHSLIAARHAQLRNARRVVGKQRGV